MGGPALPLEVKPTPAPLADWKNNNYDQKIYKYNQISNKFKYLLDVHQAVDDFLFQILQKYCNMLLRDSYILKILQNYKNWTIQYKSKATEINHLLGGESWLALVVADAEDNHR